MTAQGESGNFTNRVYWTKGPADARGPRFGAMRERGPTPAGAPLVVHARMRVEPRTDISIP